VGKKDRIRRAHCVQVLYYSPPTRTCQFYDAFWSAKIIGPQACKTNMNIMNDNLRWLWAEELMTCI
jgi:hypothetical protein